MRIKNLPSIESMDGSQDALVIEQTDGSEDKSRKVSPAQLKQYVLNDMDEVPTQNSNDTVKSGGVFSAVDDVYSVMGQMGAKNLIPRPYADGEYKSYRNMTYTVNTDGTITATATQALTNDATFNLYGPTDTEELVLKAGVTYVLSGDPGASGVERIVVNGRSAAGGTSETLIINNTGVPKEYTPDEDKVIVSIYIRNYAGASMPIPYNETFKPMLRLAADTDNTYQPYAKTNKQLTDELDTAREQIANKIKIIPNTGASYTCTSTNLEYTGVSVTCPAGHTYIVRAALSFSNTAPSEILVSKSNTNSNVYNRLAYAASGFVTFLLKGGETAYIWGKWGAAGTNSVSYDAVDITN